MAKSGILLKYFTQMSTQNVTPNICIVGAGPAGFYAAQQILKVCKMKIIIFITLLFLNL